jgi:hypothetical protein
MNFNSRPCTVPRTSRAISSSTETPEALSLAPGDVGTVSMWAPRMIGYRCAPGHLAITLRDVRPSTENR